MKKQKFYPIIRLCKEDIIQAFDNIDELTPKKKEAIKNMSDEDMKYLASKLSDDYCNQLFWDSLRNIFEDKFLVVKK